MKPEDAEDGPAPQALEEPDQAPSVHRSLAVCCLLACGAVAVFGRHLALRGSSGLATAMAGLTPALVVVLACGPNLRSAAIAAIGTALICIVLLPCWLTPEGLAYDTWLAVWPALGLLAASAMRRQWDSAEQARARLRQSVEKMSRADALTELPNRQAFLPFAERAMRQALRDQRNVALVLVDVDLLKHYNDGHGHAAGDFALKSVAKALAAHVRRQFDLVARLNSDEFAVFFFDVDAGFAWKVSELIRRDIETRIAISYPESSHGVLTASLGAAVSRSIDTFDTLWRRTEAALALAKHQGRNQVRLADAD